MNLEDIKQILELVREHDLSDFELERDGLKLRVRKAGREVTFMPTSAPLAAPLVAVPSPPVASAATVVPGPGPAPGDEQAGVDLAVIKSPIVGTFYQSSEPGAAPFVRVGDMVRKGQVLCIIEAMKLMNEIECDTEGELAAIYVENGKAVQFGERLFAVKVS